MNFLANRKLYDEIAASHPSLLGGKVWCSRCRKARVVDSAECLRSGWPKCCGVTVSIGKAPEAAS